MIINKILLIIKHYHDDQHILTYYKALCRAAKYAWKAHEAYPLPQTLQAPKPRINH